MTRTRELSRKDMTSSPGMKSGSAKGDCVDNMVSRYFLGAISMDMTGYMQWLMGGPFGSRLNAIDGLWSVGVGGHSGADQRVLKF
jgi:hypothetical protein